MKAPATTPHDSAIRFTMSCHFCCARITESRMKTTIRIRSSSTAAFLLMSFLISPCTRSTVIAEPEIMTRPASVLIEADSTSSRITATSASGSALVSTVGMIASNCLAAASSGMPGKRRLRAPVK